MRRHVAAATWILACSPATAEGWTDREICRAATKVYFFLPELPRDAPDQAGHMGFQSAENNYYLCRADAGTADFRWINKSGEAMSSRVTQFQVRASTLTVKSDMLTEVFQR